VRDEPTSTEILLRAFRIAGQQRAFRFGVQRTIGLEDFPVAQRKMPVGGFLRGALCIRDVAAECICPTRALHGFSDAKHEPDALAVRLLGRGFGHLQD